MSRQDRSGKLPYFTLLILSIIMYQTWCSSSGSTCSHTSCFHICSSILESCKQAELSPAGVYTPLMFCSSNRTVYHYSLIACALPTLHHVRLLINCTFLIITAFKYLQGTLWHHSKTHDQITNCITFNQWSVVSCKRLTRFHYKSYHEMKLFS